MSRFCLIHSHLNGRGGSQRYCLEMALELKNMGHEVSILCLVHDRDLCYPELCDQLDIHSFFTYDAGITPSKRKDNDPRLSRHQPITIVDWLFPTYSSGRIALSWTAMIIRFAYHIVQHRHIINETHLIIHEEPVSTWSVLLSRYSFRIKSNIWLCYDTPLKWLDIWNLMSCDTFLSRLLSTMFLKLDVLIIKSLNPKSWVLDNRQYEIFSSHYGSSPKIFGGAVARDMYAEPNTYSTSGIIGCATNFQFRKNVDFFIDLALEFYKLGKLKSFKFKLNIAKSDPQCESKFFSRLSSCPELKHVFDVTTDPFSGDDQYKKYLDSCQWFVYPNTLQTWGHAPLEAMCRNTYTLISQGCGITDFMPFNPESKCTFNPLDIHSVALAILRSASSYTLYKSVVDSQYNWSRQFVWTKQINSMLGSFD